MTALVTKKVRIVGAGFSGLAAAYFLRKNNFEVEIFEASPRSGGLLKTVHGAYGIVESAANAFRRTPLLDEMSKDIQVPLLSTLPTSRKRYIFRNGKPNRWPLGLAETLRALTGFFRSREKRLPLDKETLGAWGQRVIGEKASQYLLETAFQGIYGEGTPNLSATLVLKNLLGQNKDVKAGRSVAPLQGMGAFVTGLESWLKSQGVKFHFEKTLSAGEIATFSSDYLVLATPLNATASLLEIVLPELSRAMKALKSQGLCSATVFWPESEKAIVKGFGCLFPRKENFFALGVLCNSLIFPERAFGAISETWIFPYAKEDASTVLQKIQKDRMRVEKRQRSTPPMPIDEFVSFWPTALPVYNLELEEFLKSQVFKEASKKNIFFMGNYLGSIGLSHILHLASQLPEKMLQPRGKES